MQLIAAITSLSLNRILWCFFLQTKPLIRLQPDLDSITGERILTCYLLPQQHTDDQEGNHPQGCGGGGWSDEGSMFLDLYVYKNL